MATAAVAMLLPLSSVTGASAATPTPADASAPAPNLVLDYDFNGDLSTGVVTDSSGSGLNGTLVNPQNATQVTGVDGSKALSLPGGDTTSTTAPYVKIPNGLFQNRHAMTISTWLNWAGGPDFQWVYSLGKDQNTATFLTPAFADATEETRSSIKPANGTAEVGVQSSAKLPVNKWFDLVTTIDGQNIDYYINGVLVSTQKATIDLASVMYSATNTTSGYIGKPFWTGHPFLNGVVDNFQVYDAAMTPTEVAGLAGDQLATPTALTQTSFAITSPVGVAPALPATATAHFSDEIDRGVPISWDPVDPSQYAGVGNFTVHGTAGGTAVTADVSVIVANEQIVDLSKPTGAFNNGADGILYGMYNKGVPSDNLLQGMGVKTNATKAQDGQQHPGSDAMEVLKPFVDSGGGDLLIYMTDVYRNFPYERTSYAQYQGYMTTEVQQVMQEPLAYRKHVVFIPYNEPDGNWFSGLPSNASTITNFDNEWLQTYQLIKGIDPDARIAGPNMSWYYPTTLTQFLTFCKANNCLPDVMTWHDLGVASDIRAHVAAYRTLEDNILGNGVHLPVNLDEYAANSQLTDPSQMVEWLSAIEDTKVDADLAYWSVNGSLGDSAASWNTPNAQWWLYNWYSSMTGSNTVQMTYPQGTTDYTPHGVASINTAKKQARVIVSDGGTPGTLPTLIKGIDPAVFGSTVHVTVQADRWSGLTGEAATPTTVSDSDMAVSPDGSITVSVDADTMTAYQIIIAPGGNGSSTTADATWIKSYEAEAATLGGAGYNINTEDFATSGRKDVGGLRTGSTTTIGFNVNVPSDGNYTMAVFAGSFTGASDVHGPTNIYARVDGGPSQEIWLPVGYQWVQWFHANSTLHLTAGAHVITLATTGDNGGATDGDAIIDKIDLSLNNPAVQNTTVYEAEQSQLNGAAENYSAAGQSGAGFTDLTSGDSDTFWVYSAADGYSDIAARFRGTGSATLAVNDAPAQPISGGSSTWSTATSAVYLTAGINKVVVTGGTGTVSLDKLAVTPVAADSDPAKSVKTYQAENATLAGTAVVDTSETQSHGGVVNGIDVNPTTKASTGSLTFHTTAPAAGTYIMSVRYSNYASVPATHYNPDIATEGALISVNGDAGNFVNFANTYNFNQFGTVTVPVTLTKGDNTIAFSAQQQYNFDGVTVGTITTNSSGFGAALRPSAVPYIDQIQLAQAVAIIPTITTGTPTITGNPVVGSTLTAEPGTWTPSDTPLSYQWLSNGTAITGATSNTYTPTSSDVGTQISVTVDATQDGTASATSAPTSMVQGLVAAGTPSITGTPAVGSSLTADPGTWAPSDAILSYQWLSNGSPVTGAGGNTYTPTASDAGKHISVTVTGNKSGYVGASATSVATGTVTNPANAATVTLASANAPSAAGWYAQNVTVTLVAPAAGQKVQYSLDDGTWTNYSKVLTISANGATTLDTRVLDSKGNLVGGSTTERVVKIDKTKPVVTLTRTPDVSTGTPRNPMSFLFTATDTYSGVVGIQYQINGGTWVTAGSDSLVLDQVGTYSIAYKAIDAAGNATAIKTVTATIKADVTTSVKASASTVKVGTPVTLFVAGFARYDNVKISYGATSNSVLTDVNGGAKVTIIIPADTPTGAMSITVTGSDGITSATSTITIK